MAALSRRAGIVGHARGVTVMRCRRASLVSVLLLAVAGVTALPVASASPQAGDQCHDVGVMINGGPGPSISPDGALVCDPLNSIWVTRNAPTGPDIFNQPCTHVGDVSAQGPYTARCTQTPSGAVWKQFAAPGYR